MFTLNCRGRLLSIDRPLVMGIINVTPDSFFEGSRKTDIDAVIATAREMLNAGADMLDVGGQSTRPGSEAVAAEEEAARVVPAIEALVAAFPAAYISVDTWYADVAKQAIEAGAVLVNDVSGGTGDPGLWQTVADAKVPYILMHSRGTPANMQELATYGDVVTEVLDYLISRIHECRSAGIDDIIIDPGFGFAKTISHNFELLNNLEAFKILDLPVLAGLSRKATVYKTLGTDAAHALNGTTVLNTVALMKGASILRVHDVREAKEVVQLTAACWGNKKSTRKRML